MAIYMLMVVENRGLFISLRLKLTQAIKDKACSSPRCLRLAPAQTMLSPNGDLYSWHDVHGQQIQ